MKKVTNSNPPAGGQIINRKWKMENSSNGQSLVEVVVAVALIFTAVVALLGLATASLKGTGFSNNKTKAVKLANEEMELVRAYRDSKAWSLFKINLADNCSGTTDNDYCSIGDSGFLTLEEDAESRGIFTRYFTGEVVSDDKVKITIYVTWQSHGEDQEVTISSVLTNWQ